MAKILLGITGGIAAYKATQIIRLLSEAGHDVKVLPTKNALRFIGATTLEALSHNTIDDDVYTDVAEVKHVELGQSAELVVVAPATAAFLARYANGIADDLLLNCLLATKAPVLVAPAMHSEMWQHPSTARNVATLRADGIQVLEPATGRLTGSDSGVGRLPEPNEIVDAALELLRSNSEVSRARQDLEGRRILISAGGTREQIDPVRFIGNNSSGKQGIALAKAASSRGAEVILIGANMPPVQGVDYIPVVTTEDLERELTRNFGNCDAYISAAAVSDFRAETPSASKLKRTSLSQGFDLHLVPNPDLLAGITKTKRPDQLVVGFAAETAGSRQALEAAARAKLASKGCDLVVANDVSGGAVFDADSTNVLIVDESGVVNETSGDKLKAAHAILDVIAARLATQ